MARIAKARACPFCASSSGFVECMDFGTFSYQCNDCGAQGPDADGDGCDDTADNYHGRRKAIQAWNQRKRRTVQPNVAAPAAHSPVIDGEGSRADPLPPSETNPHG